MMKPITLATLPQSTEQEVFDYVAHHLCTQNEKSTLVEDTQCVYRNFNNLKCAAGCLIADNEYKGSFEGNSWEELIAKDLVPSDHEVLIMDLQHVHDGFDVSNWGVQLSYVADEFSLKFNQG